MSETKSTIMTKLGVANAPVTDQYMSRDGTLSGANLWRRIRANIRLTGDIGSSLHKITTTTSDLAIAADIETKLAAGALAGKSLTGNISFINASGLRIRNGLSTPVNGDELLTLRGIDSGTTVKSLLARRVFKASSLNELRGISRDSLEPYSLCYVSGYSAANDGGAGFYFYNSVAVGTDDGYSIITPDGAGAGRWYPLFIDELNVKRFGARGDASTNDAPAIQRAINAALAGSIRRVYIPPGVYNITSPLYVGVSAGNPAGNTEGLRQGRIEIYGCMSGSHTNLTGGTLVGTVIRYGQSSGNAINILTTAGDNDNLHNIYLHDFAIKMTADTTGYGIRVNNVSINTVFERIAINYGSASLLGGGMYLTGCFQFKCNSCVIYGSGFGVGVKFAVGTVEPTVGGGNILFEDVNSQDFTIGWDLGNVYSQELTHDYRGVLMVNCQGKGCRIGLRIRRYIVSFLGINNHFEENGLGDSGYRCDIHISDSAGWDNPENDSGNGGVPGCISFIGGSLMSNGLGDVNFSNIIVGTVNPDLGSYERFVGPIKLDSVTFGNMLRRGIKKHNSTVKNNPIIIDDCSFYCGRADCRIVEIDSGSSAREILFRGHVNTNVNAVVPESAGPITIANYVRDPSGVSCLHRAQFDLPFVSKVKTISSSGVVDLKDSIANILEVTGGVNISGIINGPAELKVVALGGCNITHSLGVVLKDSIDANMPINGVLSLLRTSAGSYVEISRSFSD